MEAKRQNATMLKFFFKSHTDDVWPIQNYWIFERKNIELYEKKVGLELGMAMDLVDRPMFNLHNVSFLCG